MGKIWGVGGGSIRKPGDLLSEWERRRPDTGERKRNRIHAVPRPHAQAGRRGSGAQRMFTAPAQVPSGPGDTGPGTPIPRPALQETAPARARGGPTRQRRRPWGTLEERPRHSSSPYRCRGPPQPRVGGEGRSTLQSRLATSPRAVHAKTGVCEGTGARRGEGRRNSRSSWPRPCRRSAPPARPAGLSAPVARGPPSSRAGSGRERRPGRPEGLGGRLRRGWSPCAGGADPRSEQPRRRRRRGDYGWSCDRGTRREAAAAAVRAAGGQPPAAPPTPRDATGPAPAPPRPFRFSGFPSPAELAALFWASPSSPDPLPGLPVLHFAPIPAPQFPRTTLQTTPSHLRPVRPGAWALGSCSSPSSGVIRWRNQGQRGGQDYNSQWS